MTVARNAPCPCGSGKKYKRCCLTKDEQAKLKPQSKASVPAIKKSAKKSTPKTPPKAPEAKTRSIAPEVQDEYDRWSAFFDAYTEAPPDKKLEMAYTYIEEESDFNEEVFFELTNEMALPLQRAGMIDEFEKFLDSIQQRFPDVYQEEIYWVSHWRVENALLTGRDIHEFLIPIAGPPLLKSIDHFFDFVDKLLFHGKLDEVADVLWATLPSLDDDQNIFESGKDRLRQLAVILYIERWIRDNPGQEPKDELTRAITPFLDLEREEIDSIIGLMAGTVELAPDIKEFATLSDPDDLDRFLFRLSLVFGRMLHQRWGWSLSRAYLARRTLLDYWGWREVSQAEDLIPHAGSLEKFLKEEMKSFLFLAAHRSVAFYTAIPNWMVFLADLGVVLKETSSQELKKIEEVRDVLQGVLHNMNDPALQTILDEPWELPPGSPGDGLESTS